MTTKVFPTDFGHLGSVGTSFTLLSDDGATNGYVLISDILGLISSSNVTAALGFAPAPLAAPAFGGNPTASSPSSNDNSTKLVNSSWVISYVQNTAMGMKNMKDACRAAATGNVVVVSPGVITFDGITPNAGDRLALLNQSSTSEGGIYIWNGSSSPMTRSTDANVSADFTEGMFFWIVEGTTYADTGWILNTNVLITLGATPLSFVQIAGSTTNAGTGLVKIGNTISLGNVANLRILANISGGTTSASEHSLTQILDAIIGSTDGMFIRRVAGVWVAATVLDFAALPTSVKNTPISFPFSGRPSPAQRVCIPLNQAWTLPANFSGSSGYADTPGTGSSSVFTVGYIRSGSYTSIGTITFAATSNTPVFSTQAAFNFLSTDVLVMDAPLITNVTLANVGMTLNLQKT